MEQIINFAAYIFATLLLILFVRAFRKKSIKSIFQDSVSLAKIEQHRKKAVENGKKLFTFERGRVEIYAKTQARAIYDYQQLKKKQKDAFRRQK